MLHSCIITPNKRPTSHTADFWSNSTLESQNATWPTVVTLLAGSNQSTRTVPPSPFAGTACRGRDSCEMFRAHTNERAHITTIPHTYIRASRPTWSARPCSRTRCPHSGRSASRRSRPHTTTLWTGWPGPARRWSTAPICSGCTSAALRMHPIYGNQIRRYDGFLLFLPEPVTKKIENMFEPLLASTSYRKLIKFRLNGI